MTYSSTAIEIRLITNLSGDGKADDLILIKKDLCTNEFEIEYKETDKAMTSPIVYSLAGFTHKKTLEYVYMILKNQYLDDEPYAFIQFNLPAMPRVIMAGDKFHDVYCREHIYDLISVGLDNLEFASVVAKKVKKVSKVQPTSTSDCYNCECRPSYPTYPSQSVNSTMPGLRPQHLFFDD